MSDVIGSNPRAAAHDRNMGRYGPGLSAGFLCFADIERELHRVAGTWRVGAVDPTSAVRPLLDPRL